MTLTNQNQHALHSETFADTLREILPTGASNQTQHQPNPHPYTIAANPNDKDAMDAVIDAVLTLLNNTAEDIHQAALDSLAQHADQTETLRTALALALEDAANPNNVDPTILALKNADSDPARTNDPENPNAARNRRNNILQTGLVTAQRSLENLREAG